MKKYFVILITIIAIVSCSEPKNPFDDKNLNLAQKTDDYGGDNSRNITITLGSGFDTNTRLIGNRIENSRGIYFTWSDTDVINLVYSQGGKCYESVPLKVVEIEKNIATIKPVVPQGIDIKKPFDIYGFVGGRAYWKKTNGVIDGAVPSLKIMHSPYITADITQATKEIPMYFSIKDVSTDMVNASLHHLGMVVAVSVVNNTNHINPQNLDIKKIVLFMKNAGNPTIPKYDENKEYTFDFTGNSNAIEKVGQLEFNCMGKTLSRGNETTYYSWVYYPEGYDINNVDVGFNIYANGKEYSLIGSHNINRQSVGLSYNYCASFYEGKMYAMPAVPSEIKGYNWMKHIEDERPFLSLLLTGTHDAATYANDWSSGLGYVKCQFKNLTEQLSCGVRALDLRPKVNQNDKDVLIYHGPSNTGIKMSDAFNKSIEFLKENPSETIVFLIKDENSNGGKGIEKSIKYVVDYYKDYIYQNNITTETKLSDVRGKIILIFRDELLANITNKMYVGGWPDNTTYAKKAIYKIGGSQDAWTYSYLFDVILEDNYSGPDKDNKINHYKNAVHKGYEQKYWNLSYLSATKILGWTPWKYAEYINPRITEYYKREVDVNYSGITFVDFAGYNEGSHNGEELVRQMYINNFKKPWNK